MKKTVGRREKIDLPDWGLKGVSAKVDTGAYTSSIHSEYSELIETEGNPVLQFTVLPKNHPKYTGKIIRTRKFTVKSVKNSFGQAENRFKVSTTISLFDQVFDADFTLSDRSGMKSPILLGRKLLRKRFVVDVDLVNESNKSMKSKKNIRRS